MKPQKEVQVKPQKRGAKKNSQFKKEKPVEKTVSDSKTTCYRKTKTSGKRKYEVFGKCVTAAHATTNKNEKRI